MSITLKIKTKTGQVQDITVEDLLSVDGKPFAAGDEVTYLHDMVVHLDGRMSVVEGLLPTLINQEQTADL